MYEPIRTKPVHTMAREPEEDARFPHRSREEELDIQLAGHIGCGPHPAPTRGNDVRLPPRVGALPQTPLPEPRRG